ncbi:hypothetical protein JCM11641_001466 [Rhodosporidiobolus odoratus]
MARSVTGQSYAEDQDSLRTSSSGFSVESRDPSLLIRPVSSNSTAAPTSTHRWSSDTFHGSLDVPDSSSPHPAPPTPATKPSSPEFPVRPHIRSRTSSKNALSNSVRGLVNLVSGRGGEDGASSGTASIKGSSTPPKSAHRRSFSFARASTSISTVLAGPSTVAPELIKNKVGRTSPSRARAGGLGKVVSPRKDGTSSRAKAASGLIGRVSSVFSRLKKEKKGKKKVGLAPLREEEWEDQLVLPSQIAVPPNAGEDDEILVIRYETLKTPGTEGKKRKKRPRTSDMSARSGGPNTSFGSGGPSPMQISSSVSRTASARRRTRTSHGYTITAVHSSGSLHKRRLVTHIPSSSSAKKQKRVMNRPRPVPRSENLSLLQASQNLVRASGAESLKGSLKLGGSRRSKNGSLSASMSSRLTGRSGTWPMGVDEFGARDPFPELANEVDEVGFLAHLDSAQIAKPRPLSSVSMLLVALQLGPPPSTPADVLSSPTPRPYSTFDRSPAPSPATFRSVRLERGVAMSTPSGALADFTLANTPITTPVGDSSPAKYDTPCTYHSSSSAIGTPSPYEASTASSPGQPFRFVTPRTRLSKNGSKRIRLPSLPSSSIYGTPNNAPPASSEMEELLGSDGSTPNATAAHVKHPAPHRDLTHDELEDEILGLLSSPAMTPQYEKESLELQRRPNRGRLSLSDLSPYKDAPEDVSESEWVDTDAEDQAGPQRFSQLGSRDYVPSTTGDSTASSDIEDDVLEAQVTAARKCSISVEAGVLKKTSLGDLRASIRSLSSPTSPFSPGLPSAFPSSPKRTQGLQRNPSVREWRPLPLPPVEFSTSTASIPPIPPRSPLRISSVPGAAGGATGQAGLARRPPARGIDAALRHSIAAYPSSSLPTAKRDFAPPLPFTSRTSFLNAVVGRHGTASSTCTARPPPASSSRSSTSHSRASSLYASTPAFDVPQTQSQQELLALAAKGIFGRSVEGAVAKVEARMDQTATTQPLTTGSPKLVRRKPAPILPPSLDLNQLDQPESSSLRTPAAADKVRVDADPKPRPWPLPRSSSIPASVTTTDLGQIQRPRTTAPPNSPIKGTLKNSISAAMGKWVEKENEVKRRQV